MDGAESLRCLCIRAIALRMFTKELRWRPLLDVARSLRPAVTGLRLPLRIRRAIHEAIAEVIREHHRWSEKHVEMFCDERRARHRGNRADHIKTFYHCIRWTPAKYEIDDVETAKVIISTECANWPTMQFQFACAYAMLDWIEDDFRFDRHRRGAMKKTLSEHPCYDFWLTLLENNRNWESMFETERRVPNQRMTQCFAWAITHGYCQLVAFLWDRVGENHKEYVGLLQWRALCFRTRDRHTMRFLCERLCLMNESAVARITWSTFYDTLYNSINNDKDDEVLTKKAQKKLEFLVENCCPTLRKRLLTMDNYRVVSDAFRYQQTETFALFLEHLPHDQLRQAREVVDRIHDRKKSVDGERMRQMVVRRQMTID